MKISNENALKDIIKNDGACLGYSCEGCLIWQNTYKEHKNIKRLCYDNHLKKRKAYEVLEEIRTKRSIENE